MKVQVIKAIKNRTIFSKIICYFLMKIGLSNPLLQALQGRYKVFIYLRKKYGSYLESINYSSEEQMEQNKNIWICWLQGEENAPNLVKICIDSVRRHMSNYNIHIITSKNIMQYIKLPPHIIKKWEKGIIPNALMSDLIRTELLICHGGLWLDATVFLTDSIPSYVFEKDLFMYTHSYPDDITITYNNWLMYSSGNSRILKTVRDLLYEYWYKETTNRDYFIWHLFMTMTVDKYSQDVANINYVTDELPETLSRIIFRKFDMKFWKELKEITPVHKLSNKYIIPATLEGTYYEKIMHLDIS